WPILVARGEAERHPCLSLEVLEQCTQRTVLDQAIGPLSQAAILSEVRRVRSGAGSAAQGATQAKYGDDPPTGAHSVSPVTSSGRRCTALACPQGPAASGVTMGLVMAPHSWPGGCMKWDQSGALAPGTSSRTPANGNSPPGSRGGHLNICRET